MKRQGGDPQVTLKIPRPLYEQLKQVIEGSGFHSVTEFAVYVLRDLVSHHSSGSAERPPLTPGPDPSDPGAEPLTGEEIEAIRRRLSALGYL